MSRVVDLKQQIRKEIRAKLKQQLPDSMQQQSKAIVESIISSGWWQRARNVGLYIHCERLREVDTTSLVQNALHSHKKVYVPRVDGQQADMSFLHLDSLESLVPVPPFGILEPQDTYFTGEKRMNVLEDKESLDVLIMPGLGFDANGRRLGRGGGYYDNFISQYFELLQQRSQQYPLLVGLCYDVQLVSSVPISDHDRTVDLVVTQDGVIQIHKI